MARISLHLARSGGNYGLTGSDECRIYRQWCRVGSYDEAKAWGASISDKDWETLCKRLDFMKPQYIRCMINSPYRYYDSATGTYDKTRNIASISRLLKYCTGAGDNRHVR